MARRVFEARSASTALSTNYSNVATLGAAGDVVPDAAILGVLCLEVDTIASSAAQLTYYVSRDSGGDVPITPEVTDSIRTGKTTATSGSVARDLDTPYKRNTTHTTTAGRLYVWAKTNTGTCNITASLMGEQVE